MRPLSFWIGTALFSLGVVILLIAGGIYAYGLFEDHEYDTAVATETAIVGLQASLATPVPPTNTPAPTDTPSPGETPRPSVTPEATGTPVPGVTPQVTPTLATLTPEPAAQIVSTPAIMVDSPQVATRIRIPSINLDAPIAESIIRNGQWVVPRFAAGHLQGTALPGGQGNAVFAGHVSSISSGNVFADIGKLAPGDEIALVTKAGDLHYEVTQQLVVKNTDLSVTKDYGDQRITLITCTGTWLPLQRDFSQRLIVFAQRIA